MHQLGDIFMGSASLYFLFTHLEYQKGGKVKWTILLVFSIRARPMYRHTNIYWSIWWCYRCIVSAKFRRYISAIFAHKSVVLLLCMERSVTQVATLSLTLID